MDQPILQIYPDPFIHQLSLYLSPENIMTLGLIDTNFNKVVFQNDYTWKSRFINEFGSNSYDDNWTDALGLYKKTFQAIFFGRDLDQKIDSNIMYKQIVMGISYMLFLDINGLKTGTPSKGESW
jgi:hypothetical protein